MKRRSTYQPKYQLTLNQYSCQPTLPPRVILVKKLSRISTDTQPHVDRVWSTSQLICQQMLCQGVPKLQRRSDLGSTSDWLKEISFAARPIKSTTQWVVTHHQYWICALSTDVILQGKQWRCHKMLAVFSGCNKFLRSNYMYRVKNILHLYENIEEANVKTHSKPGTGYGFSHFYGRKLAV